MPPRSNSTPDASRVRRASTCCTTFHRSSSRTGSSPKRRACCAPGGSLSRPTPSTRPRWRSSTKATYLPVDPSTIEERFRAVRIRRHRDRSRHRTSELGGTSPLATTLVKFGLPLFGVARGSTVTSQPRLSRTDSSRSALPSTSCSTRRFRRPASTASSLISLAALRLPGARISQRDVSWREPRQTAAIARRPSDQRQDVRTRPLVDHPRGRWLAR